MAEIPTIAAGVALDHDHMQTLFAELDRKLAILFDHKSPMMLVGFAAVGRGPASELTGVPFYFVNGTPVFCAGAIPYVHADFETYADALPESSSRDDVNNIMHVENGSPPTELQYSLEAHKRSGYYLQQDGSSVPEKHYRYAVAEMIYEGTGFEDVTVPITWDKYNCFRIHNLNPYAMVWRLERDGDTENTVNVPAYGVKTIRRTSTSSSVYRGTYLFPFIAGDHRFLTVRGLWTEPGGGGRAPIQSMTANNVCNPAILFRWILQFDPAHSRASTYNPDALVYAPDYSRPRWSSRRRAPYQLPEDRTIFADSLDFDSIIGDCFHHKGQLLYVYTSTATDPETGDPVTTTTKVYFTFDGYETLIANANAAGVHVLADSAGLKMKAYYAHDTDTIIPIGTNLMIRNVYDSAIFKTSQPVTAVDIQDWVYIDTELTVDNGADVRVATLSVQDAVETYSYEDVAGGPDISVNLTRRVLAQVPVTGDPTPANLWSATVAEWIKLNWAGDPAYDSTNQSTDDVVIVTPRIKQTIFGPEINYQHNITGATGELTGALSLLSPVSSGGTPIPEIGFSGSTLTIDREIALPPFGYGTPIEPGYLSPRHGRKYMTASPIAPSNFTNAFLAPDPLPDGSDITVNPDRVSADTNIKALVPIHQRLESVSLQGDNSHFTHPKWCNPDMLFDVGLHIDEDGWFEANRESLLANTPTGNYVPHPYRYHEQYNTMAVWVNNLEKAYPYSFFHFCEWFLGGSDGGLRANFTGIYGSTIVPTSHYRTLTPGGLDEALCISLGIPIKTYADFPSSYADYLAATTGEFRIGAQYTRTAHDVTTSVVGGVTVYSYTISTTGTALSYEDLEPLNGTYGLLVTGILNSGGTPIGTPDFRWITISDVATKAAELGFKFFYCVPSRPLTFEIFDADNWTVLRDGNVVPIPDQTVENSPDNPADLYPEVTTSGRTLFKRYACFSQGGNEWKFYEGEGSWKYIVDYWAGDDSTSMASDDFDPETTGGVVKYTYPDSVRESLYLDLVQDHVRQYKKAQVQVYGVGTHGSKVIQTPSAFLRHTTQHYSTDSLQHAIHNAIGAETIPGFRGAAQVPFECIAPAGSGSITDLVAGENEFAAPSEQARELILVSDEYITLL